MNIGIDIDDTITDTEQFLQPYLSEYFKLDEKYLIDNKLTYLSYYETNSNEMIDFGMKTYGKILFEIPIKQGAKEGIKHLKDEGNKIFIITARDKTIYENPFEITKKQLENLKINYDKLICSNDKRKGCIDNKIDIFIDDSIKNLDSVKDVVKYEFLFSTSYNKIKHSNFERVENWKELIEKIDAL